MELVGEVFAWFADPANWSGVPGIPNRTFEHVWLSALTVALAVVADLALLAIGKLSSPWTRAR